VARLDRFRNSGIEASTGSNECISVPRFSAGTSLQCFLVVSYYCASLPSFPVRNLRDCSRTFRDSFNHSNKNFALSSYLQQILLSLACPPTTCLARLLSPKGRIGVHFPFSSCAIFHSAPCVLFFSVAPTHSECVFSFHFQADDQQPCCRNEYSRR